MWLNIIQSFKKCSSVDVAVAAERIKRWPEKIIGLCSSYVPKQNMNLMIEEAETKGATNLKEQRMGTWLILYGGLG
jgi:hypothetical protein